MTFQILVAVGARTTEHVFAKALDAGRNREASISLLNVVDIASAFVGVGDFDYALVTEAKQAQSRYILSLAQHWFVTRQCAVNTYTVQLPTYGFTVGGAIANFSNEIGANLVLLGSRKHDYLQWLRDDVGAEVLRGAEAPVSRVGP